MTPDPRPYHVLCRTQTTTILHYLLESFATPEEANKALIRHQQDQQEEWQRVELLDPTPSPLASVTGKQMLAYGGMNLPLKKGASKACRM